MIGPLATQHFMQVLEVISNPERAKRELDVLQKAIETNQKTLEEIDLKSKGLAAERIVIQEAKKVLAEQDIKEAELRLESDRIEKVAADYNAKAEKLSKEVFNIQDKAKQVQAALDKLNEQERNMNARAKELSGKEAAFEARLTEFKAEKRAHEERIKELRSLI